MTSRSLWARKYVAAVEDGDRRRHRNPDASVDAVVADTLVETLATQAGILVMPEQERRFYTARGGTFRSESV